jgi:hypothetical protein
MGANPRPASLSADSPPEKILFHLCGTSENSLQTPAASGFPAVLAFDFGTSPHGLSVKIRAWGRKLVAWVGSLFPAKPVLAVLEAPVVVATGEESCQASLPPDELARTGKAARLCSVELTEQQRDHLAFAVLCQYDELSDSHEADEPEVQEAILCLGQVLALLNGYHE